MTVNLQVNLMLGELVKRTINELCSHYQTRELIFFEYMSLSTFTHTQTQTEILITTQKLTFFELKKFLDKV